MYAPQKHCWQKCESYIQVLGTKLKGSVLFNPYSSDVHIAGPVKG